MVRECGQVRRLRDSLQMVRMLMRDDNRARMRERILLGAIRRVVKAARELRREERGRPGGASTTIFELSG